MSISSRIWEMNNHLLADYEVLTLAGADLTNVDKNILNLKPTWKERLLYFMNNGTDDVWNNWNKVTGSGTTLSINGTVQAPMSLTYKGNTQQTGTPTPDSPQDIHVVSGDNSINVVGKNLFDEEFRQGDEISLTNTKTIFNKNDLVLKAGTYTFSCDLPMNTYKYAIGTRSTAFPGTIAWLGGGFQTTNQTFTFTINATLYIGILIAKKVESNITPSDFSTYKFQIEEGSATTYEEYKSASYPINLGDIELCKIGTYQDKIDKSTGKNWFDNTQNYTLNAYSTETTLPTGKRLTTTIAGTGGWYWCLYVIKDLKNDVGKTVRYSCDFKANSNNTGTYVIGVCDSSGNNRIAKTSTNISGTTLSFTVGEMTDNSHYLYVALYSNAGGTSVVGNYVDYTSAILTINDNNMSYEPYGTGWYLKKEIGKVVLNGSENWNLGSMFYTNKLSNSPGIGASQIYSNYFKWTVGASDDNSIAVPGTAGSSNNYIWLKASQFETTSDLTTWLGTHNTIVYYPLATPTYDKITDSTLISQLEAMKQSYDSQTNISQTNNDLPFELNITALSNE